MTVPLVTALAVAGAGTPALAAVLAVVAAFLAHEPLLVLLGLRGARLRNEQRRSAALWLALEGTVALVSGAAAILMTPAGARWAFLLPLLPAAVVARAIAAGREKTWDAEVGVALAFSLAAVPECLAAGASPAVAFSVALPFAAIFVAATLAVRVVIVRVRSGGNPGAAGAMARAALAVVVLSAVGLAWAGAVSLLPWTALLAAAPGLLVAAVVALAPPPPSKLRTLGWTLVATSVLAVVIAIAGRIVP
jgi:hypothetical protein